MSQLSPLRKMLRILGVALAALGIAVIIYATMMQPGAFHIQAGPDPALGEVTGETRFAQLAVGFAGTLLVFIGYRTFKYIPYSEREKEEVSELDLGEQ